MELPVLRAVSDGAQAPCRGKLPWAGGLRFAPCETEPRSENDWQLERKLDYDARDKDSPF